MAARTATGAEGGPGWVRTNRQRTSLAADTAIFPPSSRVCPYPLQKTAKCAGPWRPPPIWSSSTFEDSIPPDGKQEARASAVAILTESPELQNGRRLIAIRINAVGSQWFLADVLAVVGLDAVSGVVVPKVEAAGDLGTMDAVLASAEAVRGRARSLRTYALIETAGGLAAAGDIARASDRLVALIPGYADLGASLGRSATRAGR